MGFIFALFRSPGPEIFQLGPFQLRWYGLLIACSVLIGLNISNYLAQKRGLENGLINDLLPILILSSVIGARIYYVAFEWRNFSGANFWSYIRIFNLRIPIPSAFEIWGGGIAIHGALIAGSLSVILFCQWRQQSSRDVLDVLLPSVALGQAIGRWGNFFNNEAFGLPTNLPWKLFIPNNYRPPIFTESSFFHPTFLYESLWNMGVFFFLIYLFYIGQKGIIRLPAGALSFFYLISYSFGRIWIEGLRIDPLCVNSLPPLCEGGIRIAQLISFFLIILGISGLFWVYKKRKKIMHSKSPNQKLL